MNFKNIQKYLATCFLLTIPILLWNVILEKKLPKAFQPEIFWNNIPSFIAYGENISRIAVFIFILLIPLNISNSTQKQGLAVYVTGTLIYFASWLILIYFPGSIWSRSVFGFLAPAYTPLFWLVGIGISGNSLNFNIPYKRWVYFLIVSIFLIFHNRHTYLIYLRIN